MSGAVIAFHLSFGEIIKLIADHLLADRRNMVGIYHAEEMVESVS